MNHIYVFIVNGQNKDVFDDSKKAAMHAMDSYPEDSWTKAQVKDFMEPPEEGIVTRIEWRVADDPDKDHLVIERHQVK